MQLYNDIFDIKVSNLNKIQEDILNDKLELKNFVKSGKVFKWHKLKYNKNVLNQKYIELLYQFPKIDNVLKTSFLEYRLQMQKYLAIEQANEANEVMKKEPLRAEKYPANKAFKVYFEKLQEDYTEFEFEICFLNPRFKEIYKKLTGKSPPEGFGIDDNGYDIEFFFIDELKKHINSFDDIDLPLAVFTFYDTFIHSEFRAFTPEVYGIKQINDRLDEFFREIKQYDKWFLIRYNLFNLDKLKFRANERQTILNDVITLSRILQQDINIDNITVGQLYSTYIDEAEKAIEQNKPKAAGHAG